MMPMPRAGDPVVRLKKELDFLARRVQPSLGPKQLVPEIVGPQELEDGVLEGRVVVQTGVGHKVAYVLRLERQGPNANDQWDLRQFQERA